MSPEAKIRQEARIRLGNGNWGKAVALTIFLLSVTLVHSLLTEGTAYLFHVQNLQQVFTDEMALQQLPDYLAQQMQNNNMAMYLSVAAVITLAYFLLIVPLDLGAARWEYHTAQGQSPSVGEVFHYFSDGGLYRRSLWFAVNLFLRMLLWTIVCLLPGLVLISAGSWAEENPSMEILSTVLVVIGSFLLLAGAVFMVVVLLRYFAAKFAVAAWEELDVNSCIRLSCLRMKNRKGSAFILMLSFIPWMLLCFFVLPLLYVLPYYRVSLATCSKWILWDEKKTV